MLAGYSAALIAAGLAAVAYFILNRLMTGVAPPSEKTWLTEYQYAHRGLHDEISPENSLEAFQKAVDMNFAIELDVQLSKDGRIMVFHDKDLLRMTGYSGNVRDKSFRELRSLRLGNTNCKIPTLEEVLALVGGSVPLLIELKTRGMAGSLEKKLYAALLEYQGKYAIQSFSPFSVRWFKRNAPHIYRGQLACNFWKCGDFTVSRLKRFFLANLLLVIQKLGVNFICRPNFISYEFHKVDCRLLRRLRRKGAPIFAWTVRSHEQYDGAKPYADSMIFEGFMPEEMKKEHMMP
ncbi:MAG: glycerophosphodiester phosphodiesterase family protein [Christensenella sp.]|nr:glycerophosphodiester phosphodiesterase family protein [Christensenella sp.]